MTAPTDPPLAAFHAGELALQTQAGVRERLAETGPRVIRDYMPEQHRSFFPLLPFVLVGSVDAAGRPWASMLAGEPGFVTAPDPRRLDVRARPFAGDPLRETLSEGAALGILGIELPTRRRNRANGRIVGVDGDGFRLQVNESFGNCPKYIQTRALEAAPSRPRRETALDDRGAYMPHVRAAIAAADTFFVASYVEDGARGGRAVDVSHRGGRPGFVRMAEDGTLTIPDFQGNFYFNTLGNLHANPRAGLLVPDFVRGDLVMLSGRTEILMDGPEVRAFPGAQRAWRFRAEAGLVLADALPWRGAVQSYSPQLDALGPWP